MRLSDGTEITGTLTRDVDGGNDYDIAGALNSAGYLELKDPGLEWFRQTGQGNFASPLEYYRWVYGGGDVVTGPNGERYFKTPHGLDRVVNQPLSYDKPEFADIAWMIPAGIATAGLAATALGGGATATGLEGAVASAGAEGYPLIGAGEGALSGATASAGSGVGGGMDFLDELIEVVDDDTIDLGDWLNDQLTNVDNSLSGSDTDWMRRLTQSIGDLFGGGDGDGNGALSGLMEGVTSNPLLALALLGGALSDRNTDPTVQTQKVDLPDWYENKSRDLWRTANNIDFDDTWKEFFGDGEDLITKAARQQNNAWRPYATDAERLAESGAATNTAWQPYMGRALNLTNRAAQWNDAYRPYLDRAAALTDRSALTIPELDLSAYMNPYLDSVLDPMRERYNTETSAALQGLDSRAAQMNAFGRNRHQLMKSYTDADRARGWNETEGGVRAGAFNSAVNTALQDQARLGALGRDFAGYGKMAGDYFGGDLDRFGALGRNMGEFARTAGTFREGDYQRDLSAGDNMADLARIAGGFRESDINRDLAAGTALGNLGTNYASAAKTFDLLPVIAGSTALDGIRLPSTTTTTTTNPPPSLFGQLVGGATALSGLSDLYK